MEIEVKAMGEPFMDLKFWSARWSQQRIRLGKGPGNRLPQQETGGERQTPERLRSSCNYEVGSCLCGALPGVRQHTVSGLRPSLL